MKSDTADLDTHTGPSIILGLRPEGRETSAKVPKTVDGLIEAMIPYKSGDKTLLIDCGGFNSDLTRTTIALVDCAIIPPKDSLTKRIDLMYFDGVLDEISSIIGTGITVHLYLCKVNPNKEKLPKSGVVLSSPEHLKLMKSRISTRVESEDVIETEMGVTEFVHECYSAEGKEATVLIEGINHLIENNKQ